MDSNRPPRGTCDLLVVGGGINGAGIARDAAGRGLSVVLCEQHDLAAHTSSASTKLIHGGLRYLEYHEYRLVRKALQEREVLLNAAPHITWPLRFVMPHDDHLRPRWLIRLGLFLYDHLAERRLLPDSRGVNLRRHVAGAALQPKFRRGFIYSDGWVDDARLVTLNAVDLQQRGGEVRVRTRCTALARLGDGWRATLVADDGRVDTVDARAVVNATGPWVRRFLDEVAEAPSRHQVRLVKGSHIVVPRLFEHGHAYLFQNPDQRIVFAIPYEQDFTLIGTTDVEFKGDAGVVHIDAAEVEYLCTQASRYFRQPVRPADVVWQYSGVRPLLEDAAASAASVTRDYLLEMAPDGPPLLSVFGGKLTTYRRLAEDALALLLPRLGSTAPPWTAGEPLPGGDLPHADFSAFLHGTEARYPWLPQALRLRYARAYGRRIAHVLGPAESMTGLGEEVLPGLHAAEVDYLRRHEWARTAEDILWRRSKLGLHLPGDSAAVLDAWLTTHPLTG